MYARPFVAEMARYLREYAEALELSTQVLPGIARGPMRERIRQINAWLELAGFPRVEARLPGGVHWVEPETLPP
jgi:hypothetical protein